MTNKQEQKLKTWSVHISSYSRVQSQTMKYDQFEVKKNYFKDKSPTFKASIELWIPKRIAIAPYFHGSSVKSFISLVSSR